MGEQPLVAAPDLRPVRPSREPAPPRKRRRHKRLSSPLTRRILAVNLLAPILLVAGLLYLDRYQEELVAAELQAMRTQAEMFAAAIGEGAVVEEGQSFLELSTEPARQMIRRLAEPAGLRARLFDRHGELVADSRLLMGPGGVVQIEDLPPPGGVRGVDDMLRRAYGYIWSWLPSERSLPTYVERPKQQASDYAEVLRALGGEAATFRRHSPVSNLYLTVAVPVQRYKQVVGAVMLSNPGTEIEQAMFQVRLTILQLFIAALAVTVALSLYLAGTIARPIRRLALAADSVRRGHGRKSIPDLTGRGDEIGELSGSLRDMTEALWRRMDATEAFAADVAHEIKNPLSSLRSAVETVARTNNPEHQKRLMAIIQDDVARLDRLISDISDASRLDAELSRAETETVGMASMLETLADVYRSTGLGRDLEAEEQGEEPVSFAVAVPEGDRLDVSGVEGRLVQVIRNLIGNALSFSPPGGCITLRGRRVDGLVLVEVEDDGPGIPENKLDAIFERFYSERPKQEKFGTHSGLGLSISKQIIEAHGGSIRAENRKDEEGRVLGARFTVSLPAV
ncbi:stimulus-sensing domain-containing protein [Telmatospirillum sp. J64-1]|uniref:stimulus-sensing domain-containing protein n=1 Tax=Telmatospirillum sp. J64-1 TaxID=2502183 RepID=UPI00115D8664|nr:stimulus-sensing domain-containing protein [Telmatospirillum sp. J64-1]